MLIRNVSRFGDLDIPLLGRTVPAGAVVDVPQEHAARLLAAADNFQPAEADDTGHAGEE